MSLKSNQILLHNLLFILLCSDINDCEGVVCSNNGTCHDLLNDYTCPCAQGYSGENCTTGRIEVYSACSHPKCFKLHYFFF